MDWLLAGRPNENNDGYEPLNDLDGGDRPAAPGGFDLRNAPRPRGAAGDIDDEDDEEMMEDEEYSDVSDADEVQR